MLFAEIFLVFDEPDLLLNVNSWVQGESRRPECVEVGVGHGAWAGWRSDFGGAGDCTSPCERQRSPVEVLWWLDIIAQCPQIVHVLCESFVDFERDYVVFRRAGLLLRHGVVVGLDGFFDAFNL